MTSSVKKTLFLLLVCLLCLAAFVGGGYAYLTIDNTEAENNVSDIPYVQAYPDNKGVMFNIGENLTYFYLDFEEEKVSVIIPNKAFYDKNEVYGYPVDYRISADYSLVASVIDFADGIELEVDGELLSLTGVQVADMLTRTVDDGQLKRQVIEATLKKQGEKGLSKEDFVYIIENSDTNLTVPDCYNWSEYIDKLCKNAVFVN